MNKRTLLAVSALIVLGVPAAGHVWFVTYGVHFKVPAVDFGIPPHRFGGVANSLDVGDGNAARAGTTYFVDERYRPGGQGDESDYEDPNKSEHRRLALLHRGLALEAKGKFSQAKKLWERVFRLNLTDPGNLSERLILLRLLAEEPKLSGGREILAALTVENKAKPMPQVGMVAKRLKPFVLYAQAFSMPPVQAGRTFLSIARGYPSSPITESALISVPRVLLRKENLPASPEQMRLAALGIDLFSHRFPRSRFRFDAVGAKGRLNFVARKYEQALPFYRRQLTMAKDDHQTGVALDSIMLCAKALHRPAEILAADLVRFGRVKDLDTQWQAVGRLEKGIGALSKPSALAFGHLVRSDPELLKDYVEYRLDFTSPSQELFTLDRCLAFKKASSAIRGHILAQLAAVALPLNQNAKALQISRRASALASQPDDKALIQYVEATVWNRTGKPLRALRLFEDLVSNQPKSFLADSARENLALLYERHGRLGEALDIYRKLDYGQDVAYMVDMRMSADQVSDYVQAHPHDKKHDLLVLSLGFRYLRDHRWSEAKATFQRLSKKKRLAMLNSKDFVERLDYRLPDPLKAARELARLDAVAKGEEGKEAKAAGLYRLAEYYYSHRNLLLYNSALWQGERQYVVQFSWNASVARPVDKKALDQHHWQHECFAQTLLLCREILAKYPHSRVASRAAYTGAVSAQHLSNFGGYWRWVDARHDLAMESVHLMHLAEKSPNSWLATRAKKYSRVFAEGVHERNIDQYRTKPTKSYLSE